MHVMLHFHMAFALSLIALVAGTWLFVWSKQTGGCCAWLGAIIGFLVMIIALIMTICALVCGFNAWQHGYGKMMLPSQQTTSISHKGVSDVGSPGTPSATYNR